MQIQFLDGIDIQVLDGTGKGIRVPRWKAELAKKMYDKRMSHEAERGRWLSLATRGMTNKVGEEAKSVAGGYDFAGFKGDGSASDDEMLRAHLERTKRVVDAAPAFVSAYGNARQLSGMLGYVLDRWDTADREAAIDGMAELETALQEKGAINLNVAGDYDEPTAEDMTVVDNYNYEELQGLAGLGATEVRTKIRTQRKGGLFNAIKRAHGNSKLTSEAKEVVAANPALTKVKGRLRSNLGKMRKRVVKQVSDGEEVRQITTTVTPQAVNGLGGVDEDTEKLMRGDDLEYMVSGESPEDAYLHYLTRTRDVAEAHPDYFDSEAERRIVVDACNRLIGVWGDERMRQSVLEGLPSEIDEYGGALGGRLRNKLKKAIKKVGKALKTAVNPIAATKAAVKVTKKVTKAIVKGFKKIGKAIAKVAKKVWKFVVRFNPLTLLIRGGIMAVCRLNMFKIANKCYPGSLDKETAMKELGISEAEWETYNKCYGHLKNAYTKLGGKESKLKSCLKKGSKKKWSGVEYPTADEIKKASATADDPETQTELNEDRAELAKQGELIEDGSVSAESAPTAVKEETEVIENERTAKDATPIRETGEDGGKVLTTVPKGGKVLVDEAQGDSTWIAATYGEHTGWMKRGDLAGLHGIDTESTIVYGLGELYDEGYFSGLGDPATGTAIASAMTTIAAIIAKIKSVMSKAKTVVDTAKNVKDSVKDTVKAVKDKDWAGAANAAMNTMATASSIRTGEPSESIRAMQDTVKSATQEFSYNDGGTAETEAAQDVRATQTGTQTGTQTAQGGQRTAQTSSQTTTQTAQPQAAGNGSKKWLIVGGLAAVGLIGVAIIMKRK